jgi:hypothetical protein
VRSVIGVLTEKFIARECQLQADTSSFSVEEAPQAMPCARRCQD